jgi:Rps23 Pro-64 3,4-dihydroxylase Tpa1-like proline 4-hydroxylase
MTILDLDVVQSAPLERDPFEFVVARDVFAAPALQALNRDYPAISRPANFKPENLSYGAAFQQLLAELEGPEFQRVIEDKFAVNLEKTSKTITVRKYSELSDGNIHTDHWSKVITLILYFNQQWNEAGGKLRLTRSRNDIEDYAVEVAPLGGTLLAFRRTGHSYHGYKRFEGERRMLQMSWVKSNKVAVYAQRLARLSTHAVKRLSHLPGQGS